VLSGVVPPGVFAGVFGGAGHVAARPQPLAPPPGAQTLLRADSSLASEQALSSLGQTEPAPLDAYAARNEAAHRELLASLHEARVDTTVALVSALCGLVAGAYFASRPQP
jgi:hypothetical protein